MITGRALSVSVVIEAVAALFPAMSDKSLAVLLSV